MTCKAESNGLRLREVGWNGKFEPVKPMPKVRCPTCKKEGDWFSGQYGPFCSKRCKLVDLGKWLNEEHKMSEPLQPDQMVEPEREED